MVWLLHAFLWTAFLCAASGDRPEIKNDADDDTINSATPGSLLNSTVGDPTGFASWASCSGMIQEQPVFNVMKTDQNIHWLSDEQFPDATLHGLSVDTINTPNDLAEGQARKFCTSTPMTIVGGTVDAFEQFSKPLAGTRLVMHTKYLVKGELANTAFKQAALNMLMNTPRRKINYLSGVPFRYGFLMEFTADHDKEAKYSHYWHIYQVFETSQTQPMKDEENDAYDDFIAVRNRNSIKGTPWLKLSNTINQRAITFVPTTTFSTSRSVHVKLWKKERTNGGETQKAQWVSCPHLPILSESTEYDSHFTHDNPNDKTVMAQPRQPNFHVLQFNDEFDIEATNLKNCRVQTLNILAEAGDFELDSTDYIVHNEYEIPSAGQEYFETALKNLFEACISETGHVKYMAVLISDGTWNGKFVYHMYQTFDTRAKYEAQILKKNTDDTETAFGAFVNQRNRASDGKAWVKPTGYINGYTPVLRFNS